MKIDIIQARKIGNLNYNKEVKENVLQRDNNDTTVDKQDSK